ncbi:MAG: hypothetical protein U9O95_04120 [Candidatus Marinimicrobia bacterium]|nr:hypothetical protein [Candidatus Neomarinimicrobiota bacterium]
MKKVFLILLSFSMLIAANKGLQSLRLKGTVTGYGSVFSNYTSGAQFIPVLEGDFLPDTSRYIADFEFSADSYVRYDTVDQFTPSIKPYRGWVRWAGNQFELRLGLQKITFGKAQLLRTLSWFDTIDPRDPLGLTEGVWAERFRYYIPRTNANIWVWAIQEEFKTTSFYLPYEAEAFKLIGQYGGRIELPIFQGEIGLSYNYKTGSLDTAIVSELAGPGTSVSIQDIGIVRYQAAIDGKWDREVGMWFEMAYINERSDFTLFATDAYMTTEIAMLTLGMDYTLNIGNGLIIIAEYMGDVVQAEADLGSGSNSTVTFLNFAGLMLNYPFGIFDSIGLMGFMDIDSKALYSYLFWQRQYDNLTLRLAGALTNFEASIELFPGQSGSTSVGNMIQLMAIYDFKINIIK